MKENKAYICSACKEETKFIGTQQIGLNIKKRKNIFNSVDKTITVNVYQCTSCGKIDFYNSITAKEKPKKPLPQEMLCSRCGRVYETIYGHCPYCGWEEET